MRRGQKILRLLVHHDRLKPYFQRPSHLLQSGDVNADMDNQTDPSVISQEEASDSGHQKVPDRPESDESDEEELPGEDNGGEDLEGVVQDHQERPEPLMGHRGERWCNLDPANMVEGPRVRR